MGRMERHGRVTLLLKIDKSAVKDRHMRCDSFYPTCIARWRRSIETRGTCTKDPLHMVQQFVWSLHSLLLLL